MTQSALIQSNLNSVAEPFSSFKKAASIFFSSMYSGRTESSTLSHDAMSSAKYKRNFKKNKFFYIPLALIVLLLLVGVFSVVRGGKSTSPAAAITGSKDQRIEIKPALATQTLDKTFSFPLKDANGKEVSKIKYTIQSAELRDEIIVKGQRATSVKGRTFLIVPIKIQNDFNQPVQINARDYIRLIVNNNASEKLAPDIHNDPVEVQAISTKQTRVGFPIDDTFTKLVLQVGEIKGKKEDITLDLKK